MTSQVLINDSENYCLAFSDSIYSFNEDLEDTVNHFCSIREVGHDDIGNLLFILHCHLSQLKYRDGISAALIKINGLESYGEGPQYENEENYYVLGGNFLIKEICDEFMLLESEDKKSLLKIYREDFMWLTSSEIHDHEEAEIISFDGITSGIFVSEKNKKNIIQLLNHDINNLNKLLSELKMNNRIVSITKTKLR